MKRDELVKFLDERLHVADFSGDHSNNGLQVEGAESVHKVVFGVDARMPLFDAAAAKGADFIFVHHGISWGSEPRRMVGVAGSRLRALFRNDISLYAVHLPLDAHPELGNNAELGRMCGLVNSRAFFCYDGALVGLAGEMPHALPAAELQSGLEKQLGCRSQLLETCRRPIRRIGIVSGGGGLDALLDAAAEGMDLLVTGELTHVMVPFAEELGVSVLALGHYASETTGPRAVMALLKKEFKLDCEFIDLPTGL